LLQHTVKARTAKNSLKFCLKKLILYIRTKKIIVNVYRFMRLKFVQDELKIRIKMKNVIVTEFCIIEEKYKIGCSRARTVFLLLLFVYHFFLHRWTK